MDLLKEIENQVNSIKQFDSSTYLDSIFTHLNRAFFYYEQGKNNDSNFFTDVIYRSNQAFEGALKESYKVLANKSDEEVRKKTPHDIENYFEKNNVFRERVLQLFRNYRQEWRNKSTHDHKLFFDENEAFIALINVTSFTHLLLNQIQEKTAYVTQQKKLSEEKTQVEKINQITKSISIGLLDKIIEIIKGFVSQNGEYIYNSSNLSEVEIIGLFHAYVETVSKDINIKREPTLQIGDTKLRPDFLVELEKESIILEIKRQKFMKASPNQNSFNQILLYMQAGKVNKSIIYYPDFDDKNPKIIINETRVILNEKTYEIVTIKT